MGHTTHSFERGLMQTVTRLIVSLFFSLSGGLRGESVLKIARFLRPKVTPNHFGGLQVVLLLALSGCETTYYYSKPGVSQQQHAQDNFECKQASRESFIVGSGGMLVGGTEANKGIWMECLQGRGYTITSEDQHQQQQKRQAEYQQLMAEKLVLDEQKRIFDQQQSSLIGQKRVFDEQKRVLDEQRAVLSGGGGLQQYEQAVGGYNQEVADFNSRLADYTKQVADFNKRLADYAR